MNYAKNDVEAPFYAWECITLQIKGRPDIYLIIRNDKIMHMFIKLLIYKTKSLDGRRGTMEPAINKILKQ